MVTAWRPADVVEVAKLFERIRVAHPQLHMVLDTEPRHADLEMTIPVQQGSSFPMSIHLHGDELHLVAGEHFWLEWFPGHDPETAYRFFDAVDGLLTGRYRSWSTSEAGKL